MLMGLLNTCWISNKPLAPQAISINYLLNYMLYGLYCIGFCRRKCMEDAVVIVVVYCAPILLLL